MTFIILLMLLSVLVTLPFLLMRKPWAVGLWRRAKFIAVAYAMIILVSGIVRLVFNWDQIYG